MKKRKPENKRLSIQLPRELHDKFMELARGDGTTATFLIRKTVESICINKEKKSEGFSFGK